jgi:hypothetical protein
VGVSERCMASGEEKGVLWVKGGVGKQEEVAGRSSPLRFRVWLNVRRSEDARRCRQA